MEDNSKLELVNQIYKIAVEKNLAYIEFKDKDTYVKIKRRTKRKHKLPIEIKQIFKEKIKMVDYTPIKSPLNGVFYRAASPQALPFVQEGTVVDPGAILCIIEAMKVMNEIRAPSKLKILRILVENGQAVQAGQELFLVNTIS
ncbi:MAG: acetyl-CoA carboxylase, biotin carboxyl carrier protein [Elusimicrobiota bacterium]|nr:acetyl-CoA carboxylase, biotin carboxyl carrier protein [Elusimicrobiota bacterium]